MPHVTQEQVGILLKNVTESHVERCLPAVTADDAKVVGAGEQRCECQAQLIEQARSAEGRVQRRTALAQHPAQSPFGEGRERGGEIHRLLPAVQYLGDLREGAAPLGRRGIAGQHQWTGVRGEQSRGRVEPKAAGDDRDRRDRSLPGRGPPLAPIRGDDHRSVVLGDRCAGTDEDDVGEPPQGPKHPAVAAPAQTAGPAVHLGRAVDGRDEVRPDVHCSERNGRKGVENIEVHVIGIRVIPARFIPVVAAGRRIIATAGRVLAGVLAVRMWHG